VWVETGSDGQHVRFTYRESGRKAGVVLLRDPARGVELSLNLDRRLVLHQNGGLAQPVPICWVVGVE